MALFIDVYARHTTTVRYADIRLDIQTLTYAMDTHVHPETLTYVQYLPILTYKH